MVRADFLTVLVRTPCCFDSDTNAMMVRIHVGNKDLRQKRKVVVVDVCRIMVPNGARWRLAERCEREHIMCTSDVKKKDNFICLRRKLH